MFPYAQHQVNNEYISVIVITASRALMLNPPQHLFLRLSFIHHCASTYFLPLIAIKK